MLGICIAFYYAIADVIKDMVYPSPDENCFLLQCKSCPRISIAANPIKKQKETQQVQYVHFKNWTCTDRCDIVEKKEEADTFYQTLQVDVPLYMRHDFAARSQSEFFASAKATLADGEYLICLDFSENNAFKIQDAVQSYHWNNNQATLHPYAIYYKNEGVITSECFAAISECNKHDAVAVYLFNQKMIAHLKQKCQNVTKLIFFSDGAASQYKNKYNLINLASFEKDFNVKAEWHFFATSHGKGACDGIGGTVKRLASRASLQRPLDNQITNARKLYEWASESIKNIAFCFCTENEHSDTENFLNERFGKTVTIAGTRMYHSFVPNGSNVITCKKISKSDKFELHKI